MGHFRRNHRLVLTAAALAGGLALSPVSAGAACLLPSANSWIGPVGNWGTNSNWSEGAYPNSATTNVCITRGPFLGARATLDVDASVANLQIGDDLGHTARLIMSSSDNDLTVNGSQVSLFGPHSDIVASNGAEIRFTNDVSLVGGGTIELQSGASLDGAFGHTFTNADSSVVVGQLATIGESGMSFVNGPGGVFITSTANVGGGGGSVVNSGYASIRRGTLDVTGAANGYVQSGVGGVTPITEIGGNLIAPGGVHIQSGALTSGKTFGPGTVTGNLTSSGDIALYTNPFVHASALTVIGDFTGQAAGSLAVSYAGGIPPFAPLTVTGTTFLDGALSISTDFRVFTDTLVPILQAGSIEGDISALTFNGAACSFAGIRVWSCAGSPGDTHTYQFSEEFLGGTAFNLRTRVFSVPEPASWAILLVGFSVLGVAIRSRRMSRGPRPDDREWQGGPVGFRPLASPRPHS